MSDRVVTPQVLSLLLAIEARRSPDVPRSWQMTICVRCHGDQCVRTPSASAAGVSSWLCVACGYLETVGDPPIVRVASDRARG
jgi:hypothetical protein